MSERESKIIKILTNSIARAKRKLDKAKNSYYPNINDLELELNKKKEILKLYRNKVKNKNINYEENNITSLR